MALDRGLFGSQREHMNLERRSNLCLLQKSLSHLYCSDKGRLLLLGRFANGGCIRSCGKTKAQAAEKLGRVAKVAGEQSFLRCAGQPPAQRDAGYQSVGLLSIQIVFSGYWSGRTTGATLEQALLRRTSGVGADADLSHENFNGIEARYAKRLPTSNWRAAQQPSLAKFLKP